MVHKRYVTEKFLSCILVYNHSFEMEKRKITLGTKIQEEVVLVIVVYFIGYFFNNCESLIGVKRYPCF